MCVNILWWVSIRKAFHRTAGELWEAAQLCMFILGIWYLGRMFILGLWYLSLGVLRHGFGVRYGVYLLVAEDNQCSCVCGGGGGGGGCKTFKSERKPRGVCLEFLPKHTCLFSQAESNMVFFCLSSELPMILPDVSVKCCHGWHRWTHSHGSRSFHQGRESATGIALWRVYRLFGCVRKSRAVCFLMRNFHFV